MGNRIEQLGPVVREGSSAFNLNYDHDPTITDIELQEDIISYLCEYRLREKKHSYVLAFSKDAGLCDVHRLEPMAQKAARTLKERKKANEPIDREEAELQGILSLEDQLRFAGPGDMAVWASPPGPKDQGYGDYGFFYIGSINSTGQILMTANRVEHPSLEQFNNALNRLIGGNVNYQTAEEFLGNPRLVRGLNFELIDKTLRDIFYLRENESEKRVIEKILDRMKPMVDEFIFLVRHGTTSGKRKAFNALENFALALKAEYESSGGNIRYADDYRDYVGLRDIVNVYGYEAPVIGGSCGGTAKKKSNDIFSSEPETLNSLFDDEDEYGSLEFDCPHADCGKRNKRPPHKKVENCQHCGKSVRC